MENDFYTYLDSIHAAGVYNTTLPQGVDLPAVRFERISLVPDATHMAGGGNLMQYRFQIDHYAETMAAAQALADISRAMHARRGTMGTLECVSFLENERHDYITETETFAVSADYMVTTIE